MTPRQTERFRNRLLELAARLRGDLDSLEDEVRTGTGGPSGGNLSDTPMHLADLGTAESMQEIDATLYENEEHLDAEVADALGRIERGTFGRCERCDAVIRAERLDALPYTRYCLSCAERVEAGHPTNLDAGRPEGGLDPSDARRAVEAVPEGVIPGNDENAFNAEQSDTTASAHQNDTHAAGTAGGGSASGGLAGSNIGSGDPANADFEAALGSGTRDREPRPSRGAIAPNRPRPGRTGPIKMRATRDRD
ncbi:TraR/DksA family transcriptional regulator [Tautonia plasticadhaerens]|uniref:General stress protein 16O n=1 Tax=Tautonia plasticadhaerens TaxID=2527974 RepID=A0A518GV19_9BACT|nr:TraR/DksA C4-type zinc finger protein [Tautonia plasticadhaerens]QDV32426.1 General stress protein 16O [Tautonia plasticadhaerens]